MVSLWHRTGGMLCNCERLRVRSLKLLPQRLNCGNALVENLQIRSEDLIRQVNGTRHKSFSDTNKVLIIDFLVEKRHVNTCVTHILPLLKRSHVTQGRGTPSAKLLRYSCVKYVR
jgi:hypothetical protein